jgi:hypothetical protein
MVINDLVMVEDVILVGLDSVNAVRPFAAAIPAIPDFLIFPGEKAVFPESDADIQHGGRLRDHDHFSNFVELVRMAGRHLVDVSARLVFFSIEINSSFGRAHFGHKPSGRSAQENLTNGASLRIVAAVGKVCRNGRQKEGRSD